MTDNGQNNIDLNNLVLEMYAGDVEDPDEGARNPNAFAWSVPLPIWPTTSEAWRPTTTPRATRSRSPQSIQGNIPDGFGIFGLSNEAIEALN